MNKHFYFAYILAAIVVLSIAGVIAYQQQKINFLSNNQNLVPPLEPTPTQIVPVTDLLTYTNPTYNFQFQYPRKFAVTAAESPYVYLKPVYALRDSKIFAVNYHQDATFAFGASADTPRCYQAPENAPSFKPIKINGLDFVTTSLDDAGAGNRYSSKVYRTISNQSCLEFVLTVHTSSDYNGIDFNLVDQNRATAAAELYQILSTFKFTKVDSSIWKTYQNSQHGFEFQYPSSWTVQDWSEGTYNVCPDIKSETNCFLINFSPLSAEETIKNQNKYYQYVAKNKHTIIQNGITRTSYLMSVFRGPYLVDTQNEYFGNKPPYLAVSYDIPELTNDTDKRNNVTLAQIFSTFKFTQ